MAKDVIFSQADFDLLRLLRWGRHILPESVDGLFPERDIQNLVALGLMKLHKRSGSYVLTAKGNQLLNATLSTVAPDTPPSYRPGETLRRIRLSKLAVTAYRAHIQVFTTGLDDLSDSSTLFLPAIARGKGHNPWGNTRIAALAHLGGQLCAMHYVCPGIGRISLADELAAFNNHAARFPGLRRAFILAGDTYGALMSELAEDDPEPARKLITYGAAFRALTLPVHLLSCDDTGAIQLQIMSVPDYRTRLTRAALRTHYHPPPEDVTAWDAVYGGAPFVLAVDMDLHRLDAAIRAATAQNCPQVAMAALKGQGEALLGRYRGMVRFYALTDAAVAEALGRSAALHTPARTQFLTAKGDVVDAPPIQTAGKAGGSSVQ